MRESSTRPDQESPFLSAKLPIEVIPRLQRTALWCVGLFGLATTVATAVAVDAPNLLFAGISAFLSWCLIASTIQYFFLRLGASDHREDGRAPLLPNFDRRWQWWILNLGVSVFLVVFGTVLTKCKPLTEETLTMVRSATVIYLAFGCGIFFFANFVQAIQARLNTNVLDPVLILAHLAFGFCLAASGITFLFLSTNQDYNAWLGWALLFFTLILAAEPFVRLGAGFYQPKESRTVPHPAGDSLLLNTLFGRSHDLHAAVLSLERITGMKLGEMWMIRFLRQTMGTIILGMLLLGWMSTCFTAVPVGCRGVRVLLGHYDRIPLGPGFHVTLPWPVEQIEIVETERVRSLSLGFDKDLNGPVLWNEPHVEGEKNLLVGDGESLLTINVPIFYQIKDPVAYLQTTVDPQQALSDLAERKLLHTMGSRESFSLMVEDRTAIAHALFVELQKELDGLNSGIELVFVGLQDIHPPVAVAPAYQDVVSAQEFKEAMIDKAQAERAGTLPAARAEAAKLVTQAHAGYTAQVSTAQGEATRFLDLAGEDKTDLLRLRLRFDAMQDGLAKPSKIIVGISTDTPKQFYLDLRNVGDMPPP